MNNCRSPTTSAHDTRKKSRSIPNGTRQAYKQCQEYTATTSEGKIRKNCYEKLHLTLYIVTVTFQYFNKITF
jgi:hypothetical protein